MGVEVVFDQHDLFGVGVVDLDQVPDALRPVDPGSPSADHDVAPASQRLGHQEQVAYPTALVLIVLSGWPARGQRAARVDLAEQLAAGLVQADLRAPRIIGAGGDLQHVLHPPGALAVVLGRDAPALP